MANQTRTMNEVKQVLRLHHEKGMAIKAIARTLGMSKNTVKEYLRRFEKSGLSLSLLLSQEPSELSGIMSPEHATITSRYSGFLERAEYYLRELGQHKHLTKYQLWEEEFTAGRTGYRYSQFCYYLQRYAASRESTMVMHHEAGDKLLVDFAGDRLYVTDGCTGKLTPCEVLVMTLAYSQKTVAIGLASQRMEDLIWGLTRGLEQLGSLPRSLVCDNMRTAVKRSDRYEPEVNEVLLDFANYYGLSVLPTRVRKPKDKSRVEGAVHHLYQQVYSRMRHQTYYSLEELNQALSGYCHDFNHRVMKHYGLSREALYERDEQQHMRPLPSQGYELVKRYQLQVGVNGHVFIGGSKQYYSVPYQLIGQRVQVVLTHTLLKVYHKSCCVATHAITGQRYTTTAEHLASHHRAYLNGINPQWLESQAAQLGSDVQKAVLQVLSRAKHPEQNYKTCQGILALARKHGSERLNEACGHVLAMNTISYQYIRRLCESPHFGAASIAPVVQLPQHDNIRGPKSYQ